MSGKYALIIANTEYTDTGLAQLKAPGKDAKEFWRVLSSPEICAFDDVIMLVNDDSYRVAEHIEIFFDEKKTDDLLLIYFSGHGVKDENGALYLAVRNTSRRRLRSTAIPSIFIRGVMDECRSRRQVLILDCCNSGAFAQGTKAETGGSVGTATAFAGKGYGRVILTASDSTQFAWEGDQVIGETENSLFTHFLIKGLEGEADRNGQGRITLDDLYDYAYDQIVSITPKQTPGKWSFKQQGEIVLRERIPVQDVTPLPLPPELVDAIEDPRSYVRQAALQQLIKFARSRNLRLARSAREALERIAENDDSRAISRMASQALEAIKQADAKIAEQQIAQQEADQLAAQITNAERLAQQQAEEERLARLETERKAKEEAARLAAQKAEAERVAKQKAEEELAAKARLEAEAKAKERADRLAAQKAEADRLARQRTEAEHLAQAPSTAQRQEREKATPTVLRLARARVDAFIEKKPAARAVLFGVGALLVLAIALITVRSFSNLGATPTTESPALQSPTIPSTQPPTIIPETPTLNVIIPPSGPPVEVGSRYAYIDGNVLVAVPAGGFTMGGNGNDNPEHPVTLADYWIFSTEVTNQQYALCVSLSKCTAPDENDNPGYANYLLANDPVTGVTYQQAKDYCEYVNGRLPSEAEWEKAAQSPQGGSYPWGEAAPSCDLLNFNNCLNAIANVINYSKGASYYGTLNMSGNVFEWVADWYDAKYYNGSPTENPTGPESGTLRSVRSSSYASDAGQVAVAIRNSESPQNHRPDLGFRCVVDDPTHFAPFCELPPIYANASTQGTGSLESCPELAIKPVPFCNNGIPFTNVKFVGPSESTKDTQDCIPSSDPNLFTCKSRGKTVSISAACQLNDPGDPSCLPGYSKQGKICVADTSASQEAANCLAGSYNSTGQCCIFPKGGTDSPSLQACPVGTFYAAKTNACLPQPVLELVQVSLAVTLPGSCPSSGGGGGGGGGGGCQATQSQINDCNAGAPFYHWNSATCSCQSS